MDTFETVREVLKAASRVVVLTGAGISAESGVPTFRGAGGLWRNHSAIDLATPEAFRRDSMLVWEWYVWRRGLIRDCEPNSGHYALVELEQRVEHFTLITQNVDGLHTLAGSKHLLELHGNIWRLRCTVCQAVREDRVHPLELLPHCPQCGGLERPHIVWFGESLDPRVIESAAVAVADADVLLVIGTSGSVQPAASLAYSARQNGGYVAVINLEETHHTRDMHAALLGESGDILPRLVGLT